MTSRTAGGAKRYTAPPEEVKKKMFEDKCETADFLLNISNLARDMALALIAVDMYEKDHEEGEEDENERRHHRGRDKGFERDHHIRL